jgi:hypothetical protein
MLRRDALNLLNTFAVSASNSGQWNHSLSAAMRAYCKQVIEADDMVVIDHAPFFEGVLFDADTEVGLLPREATLYEQRGDL